MHEGGMKAGGTTHSHSPPRLLLFSDTAAGTADDFGRAASPIVPALAFRRRTSVALILLQRSNAQTSLSNTAPWLPQRLRASLIESHTPPLARHHSARLSGDGSNIPRGHHARASGRAAANAVEFFRRCAAHPPGTLLVAPLRQQPPLASAAEVSRTARCRVETHLTSLQHLALQLAISGV